MDDDLNVSDELLLMAGQLHAHIEESCTRVEPEVNALIRRRATNDKEIQRMLETLLDLAGMSDRGLVLFKRLCRYYYRINPQMTAEYVYIYRDLYDSPETDEDGIEGDAITCASPTQYNM